MHWIELREAGIRIAAVEVIIVLEGDVGKTIWVKDEMAGDGSCCDLANRAGGVGAVSNLVNRPSLPGIKRSDGRNHRGTREGRIARARRTGVQRIGKIGQLGWNV